MMYYLPWAILVGIYLTYAVIVLIFGFTEALGLGIHFLRTAIVTAVLVLYVPSVTRIFKRVPPPHRDYLVSGIILIMLSNELFSMWNEAARLFNVDNSIFTSPISGAFSLMAATAGLAFLKAADTESQNTWLWALAIAFVFSAGLVVLAPMFR